MKKLFISLLVISLISCQPAMEQKVVDLNSLEKEIINNSKAFQLAYISNDYLTINGEQIEWENILSVDNKLIDEVGLFGNIKTTDERILEIRKVGKVPKTSCHPAQTNC